MSTNTIRQRPLPPDLLTAYVPRSLQRPGGSPTRLANGGLPPVSALITVGQAGAKWMGSPATVAAIAALAGELVAMGAAPLRLTEVHRDVTVQATARAQYLRWVAAGRPDPRTPGFDAGTMKAAFVAEPGQSNHGWGGAMDIDVDALEFPGVKRASDAALETFWGVAARHGFTPVISHPTMQSEAWHFDHLGHPSPLAGILSLYRVNKAVGGYAATARAANVLAGVDLTSKTADQRMWAYVQARLMLGGFWVGAAGADGLPGKNTIAGLAAADIVATSSEQPAIVVAALDERRVSLDAVAAL